MDAARAQAGSVDRDRRAADDDERAVRSCGDARGAETAARSAGGRGGRASANGASCPGRAPTSSTKHACARLSHRLSRRASRMSRSAISFSRTCGSIARRSSPARADANLPYLGNSHRRAGGTRWSRTGLRSVLTCVNPKQLDRSFAGRQFDRALLDDLPAGVDKCGERGEFHSFAWDGPMFSRPVAIEVGEVVDRDGFVFADIS